MRLLKRLSYLTLISILVLSNPGYLSAQEFQNLNLTVTTCPGAGCADFSVSNRENATIQITGTFTGTLTFRASLNGTNFDNLAVISIGDTTNTKTTTVTAVGTWQTNVSGVSYLRVIVTTPGTGSCQVHVRTR